MLAIALLPPAAEAAFYVVFGAFAVAFVVLCVVTMTWAIRRDRVGRARWVARRQQAEQGGTGARTGSEGEGAAGMPLPPPSTNGNGNGRGPYSPEQRGRRKPRR